MGATIGINSMILLASFSYLLGIDEAAEKLKKKVLNMYWLSQVCLMIFWLSLIAAGILKGYRMTVLGMKNFQEIMQPVYGAIKVLSVSGVGLVIGLGIIAFVFIKRALSYNNTFTKFFD